VVSVLKKAIGISLLFILIITIGGCSTSNHNLSPRITINFTVYQDENNPLSIANPGQASMTVQPLAASRAGLYEVEDVEKVNDVNLSTGTFTLRQVPLDRRMVLRISYKRNPNDEHPMITWFTFEPNENQTSIVITPRQWAAHRLTFDLLRNYLDKTFDQYMFGTDYDDLYSTIYGLSTNPDFTAWRNDASNYQSYLESIWNQLTLASVRNPLNNIFKATLNDDSRVELPKVITETDTFNWSSSWGLSEVVIDDGVDFQSSLLSNPDVYKDFNVKIVRAVQQVTPELDQILFRVAISKSSTLSDFSLVIRGVNLTPIVKTLTLTDQDDKHSKFYITKIALSELESIGVSEDGYYLLQVVPSISALDIGDYSVIEKDRTKSIYFKLSDENED
jgi:hypothetical protein